MEFFWSKIFYILENFFPVPAENFIRKPAVQGWHSKPAVLNGCAALTIGARFGQLYFCRTKNFIGNWRKFAGFFVKKKIFSKQGIFLVTVAWFRQAQPARDYFVKKRIFIKQEISLVTGAVLLIEFLVKKNSISKFLNRRDLLIEAA